MTRPHGGPFPASPCIGARLVDGWGADCLRTRCGRGSGRGTDADAPRTSPGHGCGRGLNRASDWTRTGRDCGHESGTCRDSLRFLRDWFADTESLAGEGVRRALSKTGRLMPCECQRAVIAAEADLRALRMRLDRWSGHFVAPMSTGRLPWVARLTPSTGVRNPVYVIHPHLRSFA
jgi:hypothetical protein